MFILSEIVSQCPASCPFLTMLADESAHFMLFEKFNCTYLHTKTAS